MIQIMSYESVPTKPVEISADKDKKRIRQLEIKLSEANANYLAREKKLTEKLERLEQKMADAELALSKQKQRTRDLGRTPAKAIGYDDGDSIYYETMNMFGYEQVKVSSFRERELRRQKRLDELKRDHEALQKTINSWNNF